MKELIAGLAAAIVLVACTRESGDAHDGTSANASPSSVTMMSGSNVPSGASIAPSSKALPTTGLSVWQEAGLILGLSDEAAEHRLTKVLARHNVVASDANIRDVVGAMLRFRDGEGVDLSRQLTCMESGVRSPSGDQWQDTLAWCVVELTS